MIFSFTNLRFSPSIPPKGVSPQSKRNVITPSAENERESWLVQHDSYTIIGYLCKKTYTKYHSFHHRYHARFRVQPYRVSQLVHNVSDLSQNALIDQNQLISILIRHRVLRTRNFPTTKDASNEITKNTFDEFLPQTKMSLQSK